MKHDYFCAPTVWHEKPLSFSWDDVSGEVTGSDAEKLLAFSKDAGMVANPYPTYFEFDGGKGDGMHIKSKRTLALIVGFAHVLPGDLAAAYPVAPDEPALDFAPGFEVLDVVY